MENLLNDFESYIIKTEKHDFLLNVMCNNDFSKFLIDNKLFWRHFECIRRVYGQDTCFQIIKLLCMKDENKKFINENIYIMFEFDYFDKEFFKLLFNFFEFKEILNKDDLNNLLEYIIKNKSKDINYEFIDYLLDSEYKNIIINNFEKILENCYNLLDLKKIIKNKSLLERYNNYINEKPDNLIYEILIKGFDLNLENIKNEKIFDTFKQIIKELLEFEKLNYSDINFVGNGAYSLVVSIGSKILKIGKKRKVFQIDNNKRFLKPILRTEINKINSDEVLGCVEITEKVLTNNITEKDIYILYKELRDNGYIWIDCRKSNAGRLLKDNKIYFNNLNPDLEAISYNTENTEELKEGELVIIDNDYIYSDEEFHSLSKDKQYDYLKNVERYESKYKNEKNGRLR